MTPKWPAYRDSAQRRRIGFVIHLYNIALGRPADAGGLYSYFKQLDAGVSLADVAREFVSSAEFREKNPSETAPDVAFALKLYQSAYSAASVEGFDHNQLNDLGDGADLGAMLALLVERAPSPDNLPLGFRQERAARQDANAYQLWLFWNEANVDEDRDAAAALAHRPLISLIMFVGMANAGRLDRAIVSVRAQIYDSVELIIVGWPSWVIARHQREDQRIQFIPAFTAGVSKAHLTLALAAVKGEFVGLIDHTDVLADRATFEVARAADRSPSVGLVYGDEDLIDRRGLRSSPWFKPDWDPDAMLASDQIGRPAFMHADLAREAVGGMAQVSKCWEYDLLLRVSERLTTDQIVHAPAMLYHRDVATSAIAPSSVARSTAVDAHLTRTGRGDWRSEKAPHNLLRVIPALPDPAPLVSIVIPTRDKADLLGVCVEGLLNRTDYPNFEILIVDNESREDRTHRLFEALSTDSRVRVMAYPRQFNWGAVNNFAVEQARGEVVVLLNNDTDVLEAGWLRELAAQAMRPEVGVVGTTLLYPDHSLQHAGIALGPDGASAHIGLHAPANAPGYRNRLMMVRAASAVTGACLALRTAVYQELGGIEEDGLRMTWSDTDLCLKAWAKGYRVLMTPFARLLHLELATRGSEETPEAKARFEGERDWMRRRWGARLDRDPFFAP